VGNSIPRALLGWVAGSTMIWSGLFAVGNFLYGRSGAAWMLVAVFVVTAFTLMKALRPQLAR